MSLKPVFIAVGLVLLAQVLIFNYFQHESIVVLDKAMSNLEGQYNQLENEKNVLLSEYKQLKTYLESTPPVFRSDLSDPNNRKVEFLDCEPPAEQRPRDAWLDNGQPGLPLASLKLERENVKGP